MSKKIAILFFGHLRTYEKTYKYFVKNLLNPQIKSGYEVDIFLHTWDELSSAKGSHYEHKKHLKINSDINDKPLSEQDRLNIINFYSPKAYLIEQRKPEFNQVTSRERLAKLCKDYELEQNFKYDYYFFTRPDILFYKKFIFDEYLNLYKKEPGLKRLGLPENHTFIAGNPFRLKIIDFRYICENDLFYIKSSLQKDEFNILLNYRMNMHYFILRTHDNIITLNPIVETKYSFCITSIFKLKFYLVLLFRVKMEFLKGFNRFIYKFKGKAQ